MLADLARGKLRAKLPALRTALQGRFRSHHAFLAAQVLNKIAVLEETIGDCRTEIAFYLTQDETVYREDGPDYFERRSRDRVVRRHLRHLEQLGYRVGLEPAA